LHAIEDKKLAWSTYQVTLSPQQRRAFRDISACRTAALGTQVQQCNHCGHPEIAYRSCRNRHCPKCHSRTRDEWLRDRAAELLPVPYSHAIFYAASGTGSSGAAEPAGHLQHSFRAVAESLLEMAADPKRLGARIGFLAVLHTWTQRLELNPHS
jgi:hypothetical protein